MKPQSTEKVSINSHEVTCTQNAYLPIQKFPSNLTYNNSNLHQVRINNSSRIIFGQININSVRNNFEQLIYIVNNEIDILMVSETKLDDTFPTAQFLMQGFSTPFRNDRTSKGGGILLYVREDIPCKIIKTETDAYYEGFFIEINLRKKKWLLSCSYNSHKNNIGTHLQIIAKTLDKLIASYDNIILLGDFNVEPEEAKMSEFLNMYSLKNLVSQKTCFKNPENPSCINLILTNCSRSFQNTGVFETGLSNFHKLTFTVLKQCYPKQKPKVVFYRKYKNFCNYLFRSELENELSNYDINNMEYNTFLRTFLKILDKYAPMKKNI